MNQAELLRYAARVLADLRIDYMIGGSQAAVYYGEPRFTRDIDILAELRLDQLPALIARFPEDEFYVSADAAREAIQTRGQFNIIHPGSGLKIAVFVNNRTDYDRLRLRRRQLLPLLPGQDAYFARPEDVILYKMVYFQEGRSDVHVRDILGILRVSGPIVDNAYIREWAGRLGLSDVWAAILERGRDDA